MENEVSVTDIFDNSIYLPASFMNEQGKGFDEEIIATVSKPALVVEWIEDGHRQLTYFRSVDWHETFLFTARLLGNKWEAFSCTKNPPSYLLADLLKDGKQII